MIDPNTLTLFISATVLLLVTPGPAIFFIVATTVEQGRRAGFVSTVGVAAGSLVHIVAATLGISAILNTSALLFGVVKIAGALYLIHLGVRSVLSKASVQPLGRIERRTLSRVFLDGVLVNLMNPKVALFFLAFFPQFIDPNGTSVGLQVTQLALLFTVLSVGGDSLWVLAADRASLWLKRTQKLTWLQRYFSGAVYIGLGLLLLLARFDGGARTSP